jgi:hypothetical protein
VTKIWEISENKHEADLRVIYETIAEMALFLDV